MSDQLGMRIFRQKLPIERHLGVVDCVEGGVFSDPETVQDDQDGFAVVGEVMRCI